MRVLMISGSRNPDGQTARAANAFLEGVKDAGGESELIALPPMKIERCRQCENDGWGICRSEGRCIIKDDLAGLVAKIKAADAVVFATPVYWSDLSESLQAFPTACAGPASTMTAGQGSRASPRSASASQVAVEAAHPNAPPAWNGSSAPQASMSSISSPSAGRTSRRSSTFCDRLGRPWPVADC